MAMDEQDLGGIYPMVLPRPNSGFEQRYYDILDHGWYELDRQTKDAREIMDHAMHPIAISEIPKVGIDEAATAWAEAVYFKLLSGQKSLYEDEYWVITNRLPEFYALVGSKQKMKEYLLNINLTTFLSYLQALPVFRLSLNHPAIPRYHLMGKGYHPENYADWINFDRKALSQCAAHLSVTTKALLQEKYLRPAAAEAFLESLAKDIKQLKIQQAGHAPNGHLIFKYNLEGRSYLNPEIVCHVLEDFRTWVKFWSSHDFPLGWHTAFLME